MNNDAFREREREIEREEKRKTIDAFIFLRKIQLWFKLHVTLFISTGCSTFIIRKCVEETLHS